MSDTIGVCSGLSIRPVCGTARDFPGSNPLCRDNCPFPLFPEMGEDMETALVIYLWTDQHGVPLEVGGIELEGGDLLVIHAMKMRKAYRADFERLVSWYER